MTATAAQPTYRCKLCGASFQTKKPMREAKFCCAEHRNQYWNARKAQGMALVEAAVMWRRARGQDKTLANGKRVRGKEAFARMIALLDRIASYDSEAGIPMNAYDLELALDACPDVRHVMKRKAYEAKMAMKKAA